jgi:hypothetical protein
LLIHFSPSTVRETSLRGTKFTSSNCNEPSWALYRAAGTSLPLF